VTRGRRRTRCPLIKNLTFDCVEPFTTRRWGIPTHVEVRPPHAGLREVSFAMCEQVRSLAAGRLGRRPFGSVPAAAMRSVEDSLRLLLRL
jgi:mRNA-degrading endonuclease toxin of MazEF toxin-antitoxin module